jgi:hypothetical protein
MGLRMAEDQELVTVVTHLTCDERDRVKGILNSLRIEHIVSGHDAKSRFSSLYYQIKVKARDYKTAKQVINQHKAKVFVDSRKCPKCKHLGYREIQKQGMWQKLLYLGTTLVQCTKCKTKFGI